MNTSYFVLPLAARDSHFAFSKIKQSVFIFSPNIELGIWDPHTKAPEPEKKKEHQLLDHQLVKDGGFKDTSNNTRHRRQRQHSPLCTCIRHQVPAFWFYSKSIITYSDKCRVSESIFEFWLATRFDYKLLLICILFFLLHLNREPGD